MAPLPVAQAPAPATPPPPPPPSDSSDASSVRSVGLDDRSASTNDITTKTSLTSNNNIYRSGNYGSSYQSGITASSSSPSSARQKIRSAPFPTITNYGVSPVITPKNNVNSAEAAQIGTNSSTSFRGNPNVKPNTGETNDDFGGIGSLRENVSRLRWMTICTTSLAIIWEGFALPARILVESWISPASVVLGAYLGIFCLLLLGVELNAPLKENFGFLYYPLGRAFLLFLMAGMSVGILVAWWEGLLGIAFAICGGGYIYCYWKYPEYRRWQDYKDNQVWADIRGFAQRNAPRAITQSWAQPSGDDDIANGWHAVQRETQSLLHQV